MFLTEFVMDCFCVFLSLFGVVGGLGGVGFLVVSVCFVAWAVLLCV